MSIGENLKELRLMKGKSIKQACGSTINRGNYWRIEEGQVVPKVDTFSIILMNLNVSWFDYLELYYDKDNEYEELMQRLKHNFELSNLNNIIEISQYCGIQYQNTNREYYLHIESLSNILQSRIINQPYLEKDINNIKNYLFSCEEWLYYEVRLLINSLFLYDDESIIIFYKRTLNYFKKTGSHRELDDAIMKLSENVIMHFIYKKSLNNAIKIYRSLEDINLKETSANAKIIKLWVTGIVEVLIIKEQDGNKKIECALNIFKNLDMNGSYNLHQSWTKSLKDIYS